MFVHLSARHKFRSANDLRGDFLPIAQETRRPSPPTAQFAIELLETKVANIAKAFPWRTLEKGARPWISKAFN